MPAPSDPQLAYDLRMACMRLARRVRYGSTTLPPSFFVVLATLERGATTAAALAAKERVSAPSMSRTISELAERGLIDRTPDPSDKRCLQLTLTDAGRAELATARKERDEWMSARLDGCTASERGTLRDAVDILDRILGE